MRICSFLPSATEIAFALGLGESVVGVTHECDYPLEAREKRVVVKSAIDSGIHSSGQIDAAVKTSLEEKRGIYTIDLGRFREADPDLILTQELCGVCAVDFGEVAKAVQSLARRPRVVSLAPGSLPEVLEDILRVGDAAKKRRKADALVRSLKERIEEIAHRAARSPARPRVACLEWLDPLFAAGHWVPEMVQLAGGLDGLGRKGEPSIKIDWDRIAGFAPEVIVLMPCGFDVARTLQELHLLDRESRWSALPAVKERRVFVVNAGAYFSRSGPRLVDGLEILAAIIHPEIFPWRAAPDDARSLA